MKKEIGGYIEYEHYHGREYHDGALRLNCGRNALAYLIEARGIRRIALPYYMCDTAYRACGRYRLDVRHYHTGQDFQPEDIALREGEYIYLVNYYGQLTREGMEGLIRRYGKRVIVDNVEAFFDRPVAGVDTIYSCRKFFGVADGAYLYTDSRITDRTLEKDESYQRMKFLMGRFERSASEFYGDYQRNNDFFDTEPVKEMSALTANIMRSLDYDAIREKRNRNFRYLHERLGRYNRLSVRQPAGAFMYPLYVEDGEEIRIRLQRDKVYIPMLWPEVLDCCDEGSVERRFTRNILPLPIDQRYSLDDMAEMCGRILEKLGKA